MGLTISDEVLRQADLTAEELLIEMAVHLYDTGRLSMGQARNLAQLDQISFQKELAKRDVYIKYDIQDLDEDLKTFEEFRNKK